MTVGERAGKQLGRQIANRQAMLRHLFKSSKKYADRDDLDIDDFVSEVLVLSDIETQLPYGLKQEYKPEIDGLKELVEDLGLSEFSKKAYELMNQSTSLQQRVELRMISDRFSRGNKGHWDVESYLSSQVGKIRSDSILNAVYWQRNRGNEFFLVSCGDRIYEKQDSLNDIIGNNLSNKDRLHIFSSHDVVNEHGLSI